MPPSADELCAQFMRLARRHARRWSARYPHLADDFESDALLALLSAARSYAGRDARFRSALSFPLWLSICVWRKCAAAVARDRTRRPVWGQADGKPERAYAREREPGELVAGAESADLDAALVEELLSDDPDAELFRRVVLGDYGELSAAARDLCIQPPAVWKRLRNVKRRAAAKALVMAAGLDCGDIIDCQTVPIGRNGV